MGQFCVWNDGDWNGLTTKCALPFIIFNFFHMMCLKETIGDKETTNRSGILLHDQFIPIFCYFPHSSITTRKTVLAWVPFTRNSIIFIHFIIVVWLQKIFWKLRSLLISRYFNYPSLFVSLGLCNKIRLFDNIFKQIECIVHTRWYRLYKSNDIVYIVLHVQHAKVLLKLFTDIFRSTLMTHIVAFMRCILWIAFIKYSGN